MATRLYFHTLAPSGGTLPTGEQSAGTPTLTFATGATLKSMDRGIGTSQVSSAVTTAASTALQKALLGIFVSLPLKGNQTISSASSGSITVNVADTESNAAANFWTNAYNIYVWRPSNGTKIGTIGTDYPGGTTFLGTAATHESNTTQTVTQISATETFNISALDGDVIVVELWSNFTQSMATSYTTTYYYDGTTVNTTENAASISHASFVEFGADFIFVNDVEATGVSSSGQVGTITSSVSYVSALGGVASAGQVSSIAPGTTLTRVLSGTSSSGALGSATGSTVYEAGITGIQSVGSVGDITVTVGAGDTLTGVNSGAQAGNISAAAASIVPLSGVTTTSALGSISRTSSLTRGLGGVFSAANVANLLSNQSITRNIAQVSAGGVLGAISASSVTLINLTIAPNFSQSMVGSLGASTELTRQLSSVSSSGQIGTIGYLNSSIVISIGGVVGNLILGNYASVSKDATTFSIESQNSYARVTQSAGAYSVSTAGGGKMAVTQNTKYVVTSGSSPGKIKIK